MTLEQKIKNDLKAGQATLQNLCDNVGATISIVSIVLDRMMEADKVYKAINNDGLTVFRLSRTN